MIHHGFIRAAVVALCGCLLVSGDIALAKRRPPPPVYRPHVVVATIDTGFNPFHPAWRRVNAGHPSGFIPGYPRRSKPLSLSFSGTFSENIAASEAELERLTDAENRPQWIPGTNVIGLWASDLDRTPIFDPDVGTHPSAAHTHDHGAGASSQIAGLGYGMAPDVHIVIVDRNSDGSQENSIEVNARGLRWAADQPWIDIIHTNVQFPVPLVNESTPGFTAFPEAVRYALDRGKVVVSAAGNFWIEPTETSPHAGPSGVLLAGPNDNCGYADYSNPDPHIVMDGYLTLAAAPDGDGETSDFSGTSASSPRVSGYVAQLLLEVRRHYGYAGGISDGALLVLPEDRRPASGPLSDGSLTAEELHEVVRKTASPRSHESVWDGDQSIVCIPEPQLPFSFYPKNGYGEVSEHTIDGAFRVLIGEDPMPDRPMEDLFFQMSETLREAFWE